MPKNKRTSLKKPRAKAYQKQSGKCYYCGKPMWEHSPESYARKYKVSLRQAMFMQCTGEHLHAHSEGGSSKQANIIAACHFCNQQRHRRTKPLSHKQFKQYVNQRMNKGKWTAHLSLPS